MKKLIIILAVIGLISAIFATTMTVHTTNGNQDFEISDITSITFNNSISDFIVYHSSITGDSQIYRITQTGEDIEQLTDSGNNRYPILSPNKQKVLFSSDRTGTYQLYIMDIDGSNQQMIFDYTQYDFGFPNIDQAISGRYSDSGDYIICQLQINNSSPYSLFYKIDSYDYSQVSLFHNPQASVKDGAACDQKGSVFMYSRESSNYSSPTVRLYKAEVNNGEIVENSAELIPNTDDNHRNSNPKIILSSEIAIFARMASTSVGSDMGLFSINFDGTDLTNLVPTDENVSQFDVSDNYDKIIYFSKSLNQLKRCNIDGSNIEVVYDFEDINIGGIDW